MKKFLFIFFLSLMAVGSIHATNSSQMKFQQENMSNMKAITLPENSKKARQDTVSVLKEFPFFQEILMSSSFLTFIIHHLYRKIVYKGGRL